MAPPISVLKTRYGKRSFRGETKPGKVPSLAPLLGVKSRNARFTSISAAPACASDHAPYLVVRGFVEAALPVALGASLLRTTPHGSVAPLSGMLPSDLS